MFKTFTYAIRGLKTVFLSQLNFRIHAGVACLVTLCGIIAGLTPAEWCIIVLAVFLVLATEAVNTAIEKLVDLVTPGFHELAGMVKDIAAGAVLLTVIGAVIAGLIIFLPRII